MPKLRSLGFETDLFLARIGGEVHWRDRYVVVSTPSNPDFWWGNFLIYPEPPEESSANDDGEGSWLADHRRELSHAGATLLAWDRPDGARGAAEAFARAGFEIDESSILTACRGEIDEPRIWNDDVRVAPLASDRDWAAAMRAQTNAFAARRSGSLDDLARFVERQHAIYRAMQERGTGRWWGAWIGPELAGSLGLVRVARDGEERPSLGRFQLVGVDPRFGRQGVCSRLVHDVAKRALEEEGLSTLVMAADANYHAARVYEAVGFRRTEHLVAVIRKRPRA